MSARTSKVTKGTALHADYVGIHGLWKFLAPPAMRHRTASRWMQAYSVLLLTLFVYKRK